MTQDYYGTKRVTAWEQENKDCKPGPGHEATAAVVKDSLNAAIAGAKMGFAP